VLAAAKYNVFSTRSYCVYCLSHHFRQPFLIVLDFFHRAYAEKHRKCALANSQRVKGDLNWRIALNELETFLGLIIAGRVITVQTLPILSMWNTVGCGNFPYLENICLVTEFLR